MPELWTLGVITFLTFMFGGRGKPIDQLTDSELRKTLVFGTVICLAVLVISIFVQQQSEWFIWIIRGLTLLWLVQWWYRGLREFRRRKCNR